MILKKNISKVIFIFFASHLILWTLIPSFTNTNLPLDTIEALAWSSKLEWYLHEFLQLSKGNVQGSPDRPARDSERQKVK